MATAKLSPLVAMFLMVALLAASLASAQGYQQGYRQGYQPYQASSYQPSYQPGSQGNRPSFQPQNIGLVGIRSSKQNIFQAVSLPGNCNPVYFPSADLANVTPLMPGKTIQATFYPNQEDCVARRNRIIQFTSNDQWVKFGEWKGADVGAIRLA
ncbi:hypothetical protein HK104_002146, partial [Borealophlyctis nickersoniae]